MENSERKLWTEEEDQILAELVREHGARKWALIGRQFKEKFNIPCRNGKQCRERWNNSLSPKVNKNNWSAQEEKILFEKHEIFGNKWSVIAGFLKGRTDNSTKNHFYSIIRKNLRRFNKHKPEQEKLKGNIQELLENPEICKVLMKKPRHCYKKNTRKEKEIIVIKGNTHAKAKENERSIGNSEQGNESESKTIEIEAKKAKKRPRSRDREEANKEKEAIIRRNSSRPARKEPKKPISPEFLICPTPVSGTPTQDSYPGKIIFPSDLNFDLFQGYQSYQDTATSASSHYPLSRPNCNSEDFQSAMSPLFAFRSNSRENSVKSLTEGDLSQLNSCKNAETGHFFRRKNSTNGFIRCEKQRPSIKLSLDPIDSMISYTPRDGGLPAFSPKTKFQFYQTPRHLTQ